MTRCSLALSSCLTLAALAACGRKKAPSVDPVTTIVAEKPAASASPSASASASSDAAPNEPTRDRCELVTAHGITMRTGPTTSLAIASGLHDDYRVVANVGNDAEIDLVLGGTAGDGAPMAMLEGGNPHSLGAPFVIDGGFARFQMFAKVGSDETKGPAFAFISPKRTIEVSAVAADEPYEGYHARRIAAVDDGGGKFLGVTLGDDLVLCSARMSCYLDWDTRKCQCSVDMGRDTPSKTVVRGVGVTQRVRRWTVDEANRLIDEDVKTLGDDDVAIDSIGLAADAASAYLAYRKAGGVYVLPMPWSTLAEGEQPQPKALGGGDVGAPSLAVTKDKVWLAWAQRPKAKEPRALFSASYRRADGSAGVAKRLNEAAGTTLAPTVARDGDGVALAWLQYDGAKTELWLGRGATPEAAATAAIVVESFASEGLALSLAMGKGGGALVWSEKSAGGVVTTHASRMECP